MVPRLTSPREPPGTERGHGVRTLLSANHVAIAFVFFFRNGFLAFFSFVIIGSWHSTQPRCNTIPCNAMPFPIELHPTTAQPNASFSATLRMATFCRLILPV